VVYTNEFFLQTLGSFTIVNMKIDQKTLSCVESRIYFVVKLTIMCRTITSQSNHCRTKTAACLPHLLNYVRKGFPVIYYIITSLVLLCKNRKLNIVCTKVLLSPSHVTCYILPHKLIALITATSCLCEV
jgi:hypothetical protein